MGIFSIEQKDNKKILSVKSPVDFRTVGTYECASTEDVKSAMQKSRAVSYTHLTLPTTR